MSLQGEHTGTLPATPTERERALPLRPGTPRTWLALNRDGSDDPDHPLPPHVEREFRRYLECGIYARRRDRSLEPDVAGPDCQTSISHLEFDRSHRVGVAEFDPAPGGGV